MVMTAYNLLNSIQEIQNILPSGFVWNPANAMDYIDNFENIFNKIKEILIKGRNAYDPDLLNWLNRLNIESINFLQLVASRSSVLFDSVKNLGTGIAEVTTPLNFVLTTIFFNLLDFFRGEGIQFSPYFTLFSKGVILEFWVPDLIIAFDPSSLNYLKYYIDQVIRHDRPNLIEDFRNTNPERASNPEETESNSPETEPKTPEPKTPEPNSPESNSPESNSPETESNNYETELDNYETEYDTDETLVDDDDRSTVRSWDS